MPRGEKLKLQNFPTPGNNGKFENNDDDNNQGDDDDDDNDDQNDNLFSSSGFAPPPPWSRPLTPRYQSCFLTWYQDRWWYHLNYHGRVGWSLVMVIFTLHADQSYSSFTFYDLTLTLWLPSHYRDPFFVTLDLFSKQPSFYRSSSLRSQTLRRSSLLIIVILGRISLKVNILLLFSRSAHWRRPEHVRPALRFAFHKNKTFIHWLSTSPSQLTITGRWVRLS